ncbi:MAG: amidase [Acidimicrobiaceae bacterium]|nr:amidase [Acidimicrobiaceae bacterium]
MSTISNDLADLSAVEMLDGYRRKIFSPVEVMEAVQKRIEQREPVVKALWAADPVAGKVAAQASTKRWSSGAPMGALDGVPITLKDNIPTKGTAVPLGSASTVLRPAEQDAPPARRTREAGAILLGKTTMPDLGMLSSGLSSFHALTTNPWNSAWNPGGSSAGGGAAAAAGYGPLHVGTDIGGSLRLPASWNAVVSLKPSNGRVPINAPFFGRVAGPLTRTVADSALLMSVIAQPDASDFMSLPPADIDWASVGRISVKGLRIGLHLDAGAGMPVEPDTHAAIITAAKIFEDAGAHVEPLAPFFSAEALHDLDLFWRVRSWVDYSAMPPERQKLMLPFIQEWVHGGKDVSGSTMMRCVNRKLEVRKLTQLATEQFDFVLSPVSPVPTYPAQWPMPSNDVNRAMDHIAFTVPYNMSEQPAISINAGFTRDGKAIGLQISGRRYCDLAVLQAASWFESARPAAAKPNWEIPSHAMPPTQDH